jgi:pyruvate carboxylase
MYPDVFVKFAKARQAWGDVDVLPTPQFYYGMQLGDRIAVELEPGKTLVSSFSRWASRTPMARARSSSN